MRISVMFVTAVCVLFLIKKHREPRLARDGWGELVLFVLFTQTMSLRITYDMYSNSNQHFHSERCVNCKRLLMSTSSRTTLYRTKQVYSHNQPSQVHFVHVVTRSKYMSLYKKRKFIKYLRQYARSHWSLEVFR